MEPKKNQKYDIHQKRGALFTFSLSVSLLIVITAFQWSTKEVNALLPKPLLSSIDDRTYQVPVTEYNKNEEEAIKPKKMPLVITVPEKLIEVSDPAELAQATPTVDQGELISFTPGDLTLPKEPVDTVFDFFVLETKPEPKGGMEAFRKLLQKNLKYPKRAEANRTQGRVYVSFTIDKQGNVSDLKIEKGIGNGCDEEALRVIALTKWEPGKQRGNPVRVRMAQPIVFSLGR